MYRKKVQSKKMCSLILAGVMVFGSSQTAAFAIQGDDGSGVTDSDTDTTSGYTITIPENLEDGTYTGTATVEHDEDEDFNEYPISVEVTVADGAVTGITVSGASGQNTQYSYRAESGISEQVVGNTAGTYEVDTVSTATCSSVAIISAVNEALEGEASDTSISLGEAVYDPDGTAFTITIMNPAEDVDYSDISISYAVGKFSSDLTADEDYTTELLSSSDTEIVYQVVIGNTSFNVDDDDYEHDEMTYNTLGQNLDVAVNGTTVGRIVISSCATVTLENNTLSLTGGNGETLADYLELASEITLSYVSQEDEEVSTTYTLQWVHDVEPEYTSSDFFNEDGSVNFEIEPFVYGEEGLYTITVSCGGFDDVTAQIGTVSEITISDVVYDPNGTVFTVSVSNLAVNESYSADDLTVAYVLGKFGSDLDPETDYAVSYTETDGSVIYQITVLPDSSYAIEDNDNTFEGGYNTIGQNLTISLAGTEIGDIMITSGATVAIVDNVLTLTGGNGETLADYIETAGDLSLTYVNEDGEEITDSYTLQWQHDVEPEYTGSDFFNEDGSINFDIAPFVYGAAGTYTITVTCSGFADVTAQIGSVTEETVTDTLVVRRGNTYYFSCSLKSGDADEVITYGKVTDEVLVGDWDGDGVDTLCVRRGNMYYFSNSLKSGAADMVICYGKETDEVLAGDWNGDGCDTLAVRRGNQYYFKNSLSGGDADYTVAYGKVTDEVLAGKWSGNASGTVDVKDTLAVRRGNIYYIKNTLADGEADIAVVYGKSTDTAFAGDWDGDGFDTLAVRRGNICYLQAEIAGNVTLSQIVYGKVTDEVYAGVWSS